jgi:hypothetical protein
LNAERQRLAWNFAVLGNVVDEEIGVPEPQHLREHGLENSKVTSTGGLSSATRRVTPSAFVANVCVVYGVREDMFVHEEPVLFGKCELRGDSSNRMCFKALQFVQG